MTGPVVDEIDLDEMERRLREKWHPEAHLPAVDAEALAAARSMMDRSNFARLSRTKRGEKFRYRPPVITGEYFFTPPHPTLSFAGGWTFNIYENGRKHSSAPGLERENCLRLAAAMERRGFKVRHLETEAMRAMAAERRSTPSRHQQPSQRKSILAQIGKLRA